MSIQWCKEREKFDVVYGKSNSFKNKKDFLKFIDDANEKLVGVLEEASTWILEKRENESLENLSREILNLCSKHELNAVENDAVITLSCAEALAKSPSLKTWNVIQHFAYNSWAIENWLLYAMEAMAERNKSYRIPYISLSNQAIKALEDFEWTSLSTRLNDARTNFYDFWNNTSHKLDEIWWGLRGYPDFIAINEFIFFQLLADLSPLEFSKSIGASNNPYVVQTALMATGVCSFSPKYSKWETLVEIAPITFKSDGSWNGLVLMPLLLTVVRDQLIEEQRYLLRHEEGISDAKLEEDLMHIIDAVVQKLDSREDKIPLFCRWSTWLMRKLITTVQGDEHNVRAATFIDEVLIDSIGKKLKNQSVVSCSPHDAADWEAWCYRCVLASHAYSKFIDLPESKDFIKEWDLSPDDWLRKKGVSLRNRSSLILTSEKKILGRASYLLAYPIALTEKATEDWENLWDSSFTLREIVEYGDANELVDRSASRYEASNLMMLVLNIGLAIFDLRAEQCLTSDLDVSRSQVKLHEKLAQACAEMLEIDDSLNRTRLISFEQHLAIRRFIWEESLQEEHQELGRSIFRANDEPSFVYYLKSVKNDCMNLSSLLSSLLLNAPNIEILKNYIASAEINIRELLKSVRKLNQYHPRKYAIDEKNLQLLENTFVNSKS